MIPFPAIFLVAVFGAAILSAGAPATQPAAATPAPAADEGPPALPGLFTAAPPGPDDLARYETAIRASARAAEGLQGPLEGGWRLLDRRGRALYRFQIADHGLGPATLEGAWRDLRRRDPHPRFGFLSGIVHDRGRLVIDFAAPRRDGFTSVTLRPAGDTWSGVLRRGRRSVRVTLRPVDR